MVLISDSWGLGTTYHVRPCDGKRRLQTARLSIARGTPRPAQDNWIEASTNERVKQKQQVTFCSDGYQVNRALGGGQQCSSAMPTRGKRQ
eukprot:1757287-Amphidinium_carterae.1